METTFERSSFGKRLGSMLKVDLRRMFTMRFLYVMLGVSLAIPILVLVMTTMVGGGDGGSSLAFTNVWQTIGSAGGSAMALDMTAMCNINLIYFLAAVLVCTFVSDDFRSGYAKNLFTVRAKKADYVISKTLVCFVGVAGMLLAYFAGAMLGGAIAGLSFELGAAGGGGIVMCMLTKVLLAAVFVAIDLLWSVVAKQKLWLSVLGSLAGGMLLFPMIPMLTPLNATPMNVILTLAGGALFGIGFGSTGGQVLKRTSLV